MVGGRHPIRRGRRMLWIAVVIAIAAGVANPFQSGTNAELNKQMGHPALAGVWVYLSGLVGLLVIAAAMRQFAPAQLGRAGAAAGQVPWWAWLGGLISIGSTMAGLLFAQRLGSGVFTEPKLDGLAGHLGAARSAGLDRFQAALGVSGAAGGLCVADRGSLAGVAILVGPSRPLQAQVGPGRSGMGVAARSARLGRLGSADMLKAAAEGCRPAFARLGCFAILRKLSGRRGRSLTYGACLPAGERGCFGSSQGQIAQW